MSEYVQMGDQTGYTESVQDTNRGGFLLLTEKAIQAGYREMRPKLDSVTVARVLPAVERKEGQAPRILPWRYDDGDGKFTSWILPIETFIGGLGDMLVSFACQVPGDKPGEMHKVISFEPPPARLYRLVTSLSKTGGHAPDGTPYAAWGALLRGSAGKGAPLQRTQKSGFVHAIISQHGGDNYSNAPLVRRVMQLGKTARESLEELCNARVDNPPAGADLLRRYKAGDWIGSAPYQDPAYGGRAMLPGNLLVIRSNRSKTAQGAAPTGFNVDFSPEEQKNQKGDAEIPRYTCSLGDPQPIPAEWAEMYMPWPDVIKLYQPDEQVKLLERAGFPQVMLRVVFWETPYLPDSIRKGQVITYAQQPAAAAVQATPQGFNFGGQGPAPAGVPSGPPPYTPTYGASGMPATAIPPPGTPVAPPQPQAPVGQPAPAYAPFAPSPAGGPPPAGGGGFNFNPSGGAMESMDGGSPLGVAPGAPMPQAAIPVGYAVAAPQQVGAPAGQSPADQELARLKAAEASFAQPRT